MSERILGTPGGGRRRRLLLIAPLVVLTVVAVTLIAVSSAPALNTDGSQYSIQNDDLGANDVPGQKDLTLQGTNTSDLPTKINVLWNWDATSVSGKNTLDACTLFDSDNDLNANFALCATVGNSSGSLVLKATTLYTCGDNRNDRCSSQSAVVTNPSADTQCVIVTGSATDPFLGGASYPNDTRAFCTVVLADVGASTAKLLNTCSYPSAEPNSDPSDCVLVPGRENPSATTAPKLIPQDSAVVTGSAGGGTASGTADGKIVFSLYAPADTTCTGTPVFTQAIAVTGDATYTTTNSGDPSGTPAGYTITADGTYRWKVVYNGDSKNNPFTIACGVEQVVVDITP
jgi:hypothetical protein